MSSHGPWRRQKGVENMSLSWYKVFYALNRSRVKREILKLMALNPEKTFTLSEIAVSTYNYPSTVYGALHGLKGHYKHDFSLIKLKLVEEVDIDDCPKRYRITDLGLRIWRDLQRKWHY